MHVNNTVGWGLQWTYHIGLQSSTAQSKTSHFRSIKLNKCPKEGKPCAKLERIDRPCIILQLMHTAQYIKSIQIN